MFIKVGKEIVNPAQFCHVYPIDLKVERVGAISLIEFKYNPIEISSQEGEALVSYMYPSREDRDKAMETLVKLLTDPHFKGRRAIGGKRVERYEGDGFGDVVQLKPWGTSDILTEVEDETPEALKVKGRTPKQSRDRRKLPQVKIVQPETETKVEVKGETEVETKQAELIPKAKSPKEDFGPRPPLRKVLILFKEVASFCQAESDGEENLIEKAIGKAQKKGRLTSKDVAGLWELIQGATPPKRMRNYRKAAAWMADIQEDIDRAEQVKAAKASA